MLAVHAGGQYAGSAACRTCHAAQSEAHAKTAHAASLGRLTDHPKASAFTGVKAEWAFGAGTQAVTFVSQADEDHYREHGESWYAAAKGFALTPGHRTPQGELYRTFDPSANILRCFLCHSTGALRLTAGMRIEPAEAGVQCETCHGPGAEHAAAQKPIRNPAKLDAQALNTLCGDCHRKPAAAGDDTDWTNPWNTRHQPLYLAESACFQRSAGKLSCTTCHPAHQPASLDPVRYTNVCSSCHKSVRHKSPAQDRSCTGCHMPAVSPQPHLQFANHWIGVYAPGKALRPIARP